MRSTSASGVYGLAATRPQTGAGHAGSLFETGDDVDVQLRHQVAERGDVELERGEGIAQQARGVVDLVAELAPLPGVEVDHLARVDDARHQHQPRIVAVVHQPQFAQRERDHRMGVGRQLRMQFVAIVVLGFA